MPYDKRSSLWPVEDSLRYWQDCEIEPIRQSGSHCVSTALAMLSGETPQYFQAKMNTQDPVSWSDALKPFGMKLAYCPTDLRRLKFYREELEAINDLFLLCYYTTIDPDDLLQDPDEEGWISGSHVVILHGNQIIDPAWGTACDFKEHTCGEKFTKRIFRVVPANSARGL